jgi:circadian clock protein KaiC
MLDGRGYIEGTTILVSGMVGTGKTSLAVNFVDASCRAGKRALYFAFEESPAQIMRNMRSININLEPWVKKGLLTFHALRPSEQVLEKHLVLIQRAVSAVKPDIVVLDAITDFLTLGRPHEVRQMVLRLVDFFKMRGVTAVFTSMSTRSELEETGVGLSSAFDTWIHLTNVQDNLERNRTLVVVKSRGMAHSNQVREFVISNKGVQLVDIYASPEGTFMGTARLTQMAADKAADVARHESIDSRERQLEEKRRGLEARISALRADFEAELKEAQVAIFHEKTREKVIRAATKTLGRHRGTNRNKDIE